jgi:cytochrome c biogenesis protein ResB
LEENKTQGRQPRPQKTAFQRLVKALSSVKLAVSLLVLIAVVMIVATLLKNQAHARRYIYHSWWFVSLLGLFCLNLIFCTVGRWSLRLRRLGTTVTHVGVLVMVAGAVISSIWAQRGFLPLPIGQSSKVCYDDKNKPIQLPFEVHLDDFKVERHTSQQEALVVYLLKEETARAFPIRVGEEYEVGGSPYKVTILRYEPDFMVLGKGEYGSRSKSPKNPAIQVQVSGSSQERTEWVFLKFPGMHRDPDAEIVLEYNSVRGKEKDFKSTLRLLQDGQVVASKTIEVNKPLKYAGWAIYQSSYDDKHESWSGLEIAKDPGVPLVYLGFLLITIGVLYSFYLRPFV